MSAGVTIISGLFAKFRHGVSFDLHLKLRGIRDIAKSAPIVLVDTPGAGGSSASPSALSYDPVEAPIGVCMCGITHSMRAP